MGAKNRIKYDDPLLRYCKWVSDRISEDVLIGAFLVALLLAAFVI